MHPLLFRAIWLMGMISAGGSATKRAKNALSMMSGGSVGELSFSVQLLLESMLSSERNGFEEKFGQLAGASMKKGDTSLDVIERAAQVAEIEYAIRCMTFDAALIAGAPEFASRLEELARRIRMNDAMRNTEEPKDETPAATVQG